MKIFMAFILFLALTLAYFSAIYLVFVELIGIPIETVLLVMLATDAIGFSWKTAKDVYK